MFFFRVELWTIGERETRTMHAQVRREPQPPAARVRTLANSQGKFGNWKIQKNLELWINLICVMILTRPWVFINLIK